MEEAGCPMEESKLVEQIQIVGKIKLSKYNNRCYGATNSKSGLMFRTQKIKH